MSRATRRAGDGFRIRDQSTLTMIKNTAKKNNEDGFDIDGDTTTVTMTGNKAIRNTNTGIENDGGFLTTLKDNIMTGNGLDLAGRGDDSAEAGSCDAGDGGNAGAAATDGGGNVFATGGFDTCVSFKSDD